MPKRSRFSTSTVCWFVCGAVPGADLIVRVHDGLVRLDGGGRTRRAAPRIPRGRVPFAAGETSPHSRPGSPRTDAPRPGIRCCRGRPDCPGPLSFSFPLSLSLSCSVALCRGRADAEQPQRAGHGRAGRAAQHRAPGDPGRHGAGESIKVLVFHRDVPPAPRPSTGSGPRCALLLTRRGVQEACQGHARWSATTVGKGANP